MDKETVLFEIKEEAEHLIINILNQSKPNEEKLKAYVTDWLDLDRDLTKFYQLLKKSIQNIKEIRKQKTQSFVEVYDWCTLAAKYDEVMNYG